MHVSPRKATHVNRPEPSTMSSRHILIHRLDCLRPAHLAILLVHVVGARARIVADPDAEVLDLEGPFLMNDVEGDDLAVRLLDLAQFHQEIPESRLGNYGVGSEDAHAVELWGGVGFGGQVPADNLVLCEAT